MRNIKEFISNSDDPQKVKNQFIYASLALAQLGLTGYMVSNAYDLDDRLSQKKARQDAWAQICSGPVYTECPPVSIPEIKRYLPWRESIPERTLHATILEKWEKGQETKQGRKVVTGTTYDYTIKLKDDELVTEEGRYDVREATHHLDASQSYLQSQLQSRFAWNP